MNWWMDKLYIVIGGEIWCHLQVLFKPNFIGLEQDDDTNQHLAARWNVMLTYEKTHIITLSVQVIQ